MPRSHTTWLLLALPLVASAAADEPNVLNGSWYATWTSDGRPLSADVEVRGTSGSWKTRTVKNAMNNCVGMEHPLEVSQSESGQITLRALGSQMLTGCPDFVVRVRRKDSDGRLYSLDLAIRALH